MKIHQNILNRISVLYLSIPLFIFLFNWLKPIYSAILISALLIILFMNFKKETVSTELENTNRYCAFENNKKYYEISKLFFIITVILCVSWCVLAGLGNIVFQLRPDWNVKNAIMHDLINFSWPVVYDNGVALTYYFGILLPSALFGKFVSFLGFQHDVAFKAANYFSLFWGSTGVSLIAFNLYSFINIERKKILILVLFIFFSGLNIFLVKENFLFPPNYDIEHYVIGDIFYSYPSHTGQLFFAAVQCIATWLVTMLFLGNSKDITNMGFYLVLTLFYSPFAAIGISFYFITITFIELFKSIVKKSNIIFKQIFNIKNILSILFIFPVIYLYFKSNHTAAAVTSLQFNFHVYIINFIIFNALILIIILVNRFKNNLIFWIMTICLILIPFNSTVVIDFCMRAVIPSLCILSVFEIKMLMEKPLTKSDKICKKLAIVYFIAGIIIPITFINLIFYNTYKESSDNYIFDVVKTFKNKIPLENCTWVNDVGNYCNYGSLEPNNYPFWKYLAASKRSPHKYEHSGISKS